MIWCVDFLLLLCVIIYIKRYLLSIKVIQIEFFFLIKKKKIENLKKKRIKKQIIISFEEFKCIIC